MIRTRFQLFAATAFRWYGLCSVFIGGAFFTGKALSVIVVAIVLSVFFAAPTQAQSIPKDYTFAEAAAIDPKTAPPPIYVEDEWRIWPQHLGSAGSEYELISDVKKGNPFAASALIWVNMKHDQFWSQIADTMTRPGWGYAMLAAGQVNRRGYVYEASMGMVAVSASGNDYAVTAATLGHPFGMRMYGLEKRAGAGGDTMAMGLAGSNLWTEKYYDAGLKWMFEASMRGNLHTMRFLGLCYRDGAEGGPKPDMVKAYAIWRTGVLLTEQDETLGGGDCEALAAELRAKKQISAEQVKQGDALAAAWLKTINTWRKTVIEQQRAHLAKVLPEVRKKVDAWLDQIIKQDCLQKYDNFEMQNLCENLKKARAE